MQMRHKRATVSIQDGIAPAQPIPQELRLQAILLAGAECPHRHKRSQLIPAGRLVALAMPTAAAANGWDDPTPELQPYTPVARILAEPVFPSAEAVAQTLCEQEEYLLNELWSRAAFAERRIVLTTTAPVAAEPGLTGSQARLVARLAETVREVSSKVCLTPPSLTRRASGSVHMALSLLVEARQMQTTDHALELAGRMMTAHGLTLSVTPSGPVESFPLRGLG